jgi:hypothetical protein
MSAGLLALTVGLGEVSGAAAGEPSPELALPRVRMSLEGPMAARLDGIIHNWLIPAPDANPGMLEMMRSRDRKPPYEDPVPWAGEFVGKYLTSCVLACRLSNDKPLRAVTARVMRELIWTPGEPGSQYEVTVWEERAGPGSARRQPGVTSTGFEPKWELAPGRTYGWQVVASHAGVAAASTNGPFSFVIDPAAPSTLHGVVLRAALQRKPDPEEGRLLAAEKVEPAPGRDGRPNTALRINGKDSKLVPITATRRVFRAASPTSSSGARP